MRKVRVSAMSRFAVRQKSKPSDRGEGDDDPEGDHEGRLSKGAPATITLLHVTLWALVAEAMNHTWVPRGLAFVSSYHLPGFLVQAQSFFVPTGVDAVALGLNFTGAFLAGLATAAAELFEWQTEQRPPPSSAGSAGKMGTGGTEKAITKKDTKAMDPSAAAGLRVCAAFKGGFVAAFTSFVAVAEQIAAARSPGGYVMVASEMLCGGPALFLLGLYVGRWIMGEGAACRPLLCAIGRAVLSAFCYRRRREDAVVGHAAKKRAEEEDEEEEEIMLRCRIALLAFLLLSLGLELGSFPELGRGDPDGLGAGLLMTAAAVVFGDL